MVYFVQNPVTKNVKIGYCENNFKSRLASLQTGAAEELDVLLILDGEMADERELHHVFDRFRLVGEWFSYSESLQKFIEDNKQKCIKSVVFSGRKLKNRSEYNPIVIVLGPEDYKGEFNLNAAERDILIALYKKYNGNILSIAVHISKTTDFTMRKLKRHGIIPNE